VVRVAFTKAPGDRPDVSVDVLTRVVSVALIVIIIFMGVVPKPILALATSAVKSIL
ncbi:MAG: NADH-quinone oxidoreductase subunit N, partial [Deltaproteobacteria bacterium]|nr:NADH-quinone oxidoreductase subunit N [Deltaproteobacteria bacterium]